MPFFVPVSLIPAVLAFLAFVAAFMGGSATPECSTEACYLVDASGNQVGSYYFPLETASAANGEEGPGGEAQPTSTVSPPSGESPPTYPTNCLVACEWKAEAPSSNGYSAVGSDR